MSESSGSEFQVLYTEKRRKSTRFMDSADRVSCCAGEAVISSSTAGMSIVRFKVLLNATAALALLSLVSTIQAAGKSEDEFAQTIQIFFSRNLAADWQGIEKLPNVQWAPLPPAMLQNCLQDGGCFTRQGTAVIGDRRLTVVATGARSFASNIYFRNVTAPFGEEAVIAALKHAGFTVDLVRCPIQPGAGSTNWYRLTGANASPGYLSIQSVCNGRPREGFVLSRGEELPPLQPNQLRLYTEKCSATGPDREPVSTVMPHEQLARTLITLLPRADGPALYEWKTLTNLPTGIKWDPAGARKGDLSYKGDANPWMDQGQIAFSGRRFYLLFSGSPTQVKTAYFEEGGTHPRGEDLLGWLRAERFVVQLVRCGPAYTQSTNNWYRVTGANTRPVMLKQSIRRDGNQAQDSYELRLDATLPKRDPRDRDPGTGDCN
jgi:hypothetical protein